MHVKAIAGLMLVLMMPLTVAFAENWVQLGEYVGKNGAQVHRFIDMDSITKTDLYTQYVTKQEYSTLQNLDNNVSYTLSKIISTMNCQEKQMRADALQLYNGEGKQVYQMEHTQAPENMGFYPVQPGTFYDLEYKHVCK
jgi:hypothetical protein